MRLTRRGWCVLGLVAVSVALAWLSGPRSLNAVVGPLVVALAAGALTTRRAGRPTVDREPIAAGTVGERRTVRVRFGVETPVAATVTDAVGEGLVADGAVAETTLTGEGHRYEIDLERRGIHEVGPVTVTVTDVLGLVERRFRYEDRETVTVYPSTDELRGEADAVRRLEGVGVAENREEFDHLREYERGDALRDVHWKSAAKRPDAELVVKEFAGGGEQGAVGVVATGVRGRSDELARATASVTRFLLEAGRPVELTTADGRDSAGSPLDGRRLLELLAVLGPGEVDEEALGGADVTVRAGRDGIVVEIEGVAIPYDRLRGRADEPREVVA